MIFGMSDILADPAVQLHWTGIITFPHQTLQTVGASDPAGAPSIQSISGVMPSPLFYHTQ